MRILKYNLTDTTTGTTTTVYTYAEAQELTASNPAMLCETALEDVTPKLVVRGEHPSPQHPEKMIKEWGYETLTEVLKRKRG